MSVGEIGLKSRRPSTPGANTQVVYNQGGVDGANANLTFDYVSSSLNVTGNIVTLPTSTGGGGHLGVHGGFSNGVINAAIGGVYIGMQANGNLQTIQLFTSNAAVDNAWWEINAQNTGILEFRTANNAYGNIVRWMQVLRANANSNIGSIRLGNPNDLPLVTIYGGIDTVGKNVVAGNTTISQNISTGNISITQNLSVGNINAAASLATGGYIVTRGNFPGLPVLNSVIGGTFIGGQALGNNQGIEFFAANAAVDNAWWEIIAQNSGTLAFRTANDNYDNIGIWLQVDRANANANIGLITIGNNNDKPNVIIRGNIVNALNIYTGNLQATLNILSGNITAIQNVSVGNLSITQNVILGNIQMIQNTTAGNIQSNQNVLSGNIQAVQNTLSGNLLVTQNVAIGNLALTGNVTGFMNVTGNVASGGINISTIFNPSYYNYAGGV